MSPTPWVNSESNFQHGEFAELLRERKAKKRDMGDAGRGINRRQWRHIMANAARGPEDEPDSPTLREDLGSDGKEITDFDGLIRPGMYVL